MPGFHTDRNQTSKNQELTFVGPVALLSPDNIDVMHTWSFDTIDQPACLPGSGLAADDVYYSSGFTIVIAEIPVLTGNPGTEYSPINNNLGSGNPTLSPMPQYESKSLQFHLAVCHRVSYDYSL